MFKIIIIIIWVMFFDMDGIFFGMFFFCCLFDNVKVIDKLELF